MRLIALATAFGVGLAAVASLICVLFVVDQSEQAIIVEFGESKGGVIDRPGLHWKMPFIQEVRRFDKRLLIWDGDPNQSPSRGREFISVDAAARWRIVDPSSSASPPRENAEQRRSGAARMPR
jgi:membrane protease subunit HflC